MRRTCATVTADGEVDVALLQEAAPPPEGAAHEAVPTLSERWVTAGGDRRFCAAIARLSDRVNLKPIRTRRLGDAGPDELAVSLLGSLAAAEVTDASGEQIIVVSIYGAWASPIPSRQGSWIYADASIHRLISDVSALVASQRGHKILVAGDLNILYGHVEGGSDYWRLRYDTVFTRRTASDCPSSVRSTPTRTVLSVADRAANGQ